MISDLVNFSTVILQTFNSTVILADSGSAEKIDTSVVALALQLSMMVSQILQLLKSQQFHCNFIYKFMLRIRLCHILKKIKLGIGKFNTDSFK